MITLHRFKTVFMENRSLTSYIGWLMFMLADGGTLIFGAQRRQSWLITLTGMGLIAGIMFEDSHYPD